MKGIRVYIEGGGDRASQKQTLRLGFQTFLSELRDRARAKRLTWDVVLCGGRAAAYDDYLSALRTHPDTINLLLVDAEGPVSDPPWRHLRQRDGWDDRGVGDGWCHLMVQMVEAWIGADPDALAAYYGDGFRRASLPANPNIEEVTKDDLIEALNRAPQATSKGKYRKIQHCADLLQRVSVARVRDRAAHCDRLFRTVADMVDTVVR